MTLRKELRTLGKTLNLVSKRGLLLLLLSCIGICIPLCANDTIDGNEIYGLCNVPLAFVSGIAFLFFRNSSRIRNAAIVACIAISFFLFSMNSGNINQTTFRDFGFMYGFITGLCMLLSKALDRSRGARNLEEFREIFSIRRGWLDM